MAEMLFHAKTFTFSITVEKEYAEWLSDTLPSLQLENKATTLGQLKATFEEHFEDFELFWFSKPIEQLKQNSFLCL